MEQKKKTQKLIKEEINKYGAFSRNGSNVAKHEMVVKLT